MSLLDSPGFSASSRFVKSGCHTFEYFLKSFKFFVIGQLCFQGADDFLTVGS